MDVAKESLKYRTLIKISIILWNREDVRALTEDLFIPSLPNGGQEEWHLINDRVIEKVQLLSIPKTLKMGLVNFITQVGKEIFKWKESHERILLNEKEELAYINLNRLCWTSHGMVDKKKTAEVMSKNEHIYIANRFELASIYCLENYISELWHRMPQISRQMFYNDDESFMFSCDWPMFWAYYINGKASLLISLIQGRRREYTPFQFAFEHAALTGNEVATEFFYQKLSPEERKDRNFARILGCVKERLEYIHTISLHAVEMPFKGDYEAVLQFFLSQMNEKQKEVYNRYPSDDLELFWPE